MVVYEAAEGLYFLCPGVRFFGLIGEVDNMTQNQVSVITYYQRKGLGYRRIAPLVGVPEDTVKSFCRKNKGTAGDKCITCGAAVEQRPHKKRKLFCSDKCRLKWWNAHPELVRRKRKEHICEYCGRPYMTHIKSQRYCSRECFANARKRVVSKV